MDSDEDWQTVDTDEDSQNMDTDEDSQNMDMNEDGRPILRFVSPALCKLCKSIAVDFSKPSPTENNPSLHSVDFNRKYWPVKVSATIINSQQNAENAIPYQPSFPELIAGRESGCPFCAFLVQELNLKLALESLAVDTVNCATIHLEFEVPAAYKRGGYASIPISFRTRFEGPYRIYVKVYSVSQKGDVESVKELNAILDGYTNIDLSKSLPDPYALSFRNIKLIKHWLEDCELHHEECKLENPTFIPSRLLDVGTDDSPLIKLIVPDRKVSYVALSYCWGKNFKEKFPTMKANIGRRLHGQLRGDAIPILPATLQEACQATRALGIRYLWIDSLCIIQDDINDWEIESGKMSDIYSNSTITFAATSSTSVASGLSLSRPENRTLELEIGAIDNSDCRARLCVFAPEVSYTYRLMKGLDSEPNESAWNARAWTLQEHLLSSRILHFTSRLLYFECRESQHLESPLYDGWQEQYWISRAGFDRDMQDPQTGLRTTPHNIWYNIITSNYCRRGLTFDKDKLPAISGLAKELHRHMLGDRYLAGLWEKDLPQGLLWRCRIDGATKRAPEYRAPSWSWAAVDVDGYEIIWQWAGVREGRESQLILLETNVTLGKDNYGQVHSGHIILSGKLIDASQIYSHSLHDPYGDAYFMRDTSTSWLSGSSSQAYLDIFEENEHHKEGSGLKALLVLASFYPREQTDLLMGLLLRRVGNTSDPALQCQLKSMSPGYQDKEAIQGLEVYERAGAFHLRHRDGPDCSLTLNIPSKRIVLI